MSRVPARWAYMDAGEVGINAPRRRVDLASGVTQVRPEDVTPEYERVVLDAMKANPGSVVIADYELES